MNYLLDEGLMEFYSNIASNGIGNFQSKRFLNDALIAIPSNDKLLQNLSFKLNAFDTSSLSYKIAKLKETRDLLLPKLISGKVTI